MNEFVPRGYLTLKKALEHFGKLKHGDKWEAEKASSQQEFQQLLFEGTVPAEHFIGGRFFSLESSIWGTVETERIFETEQASRSVGNEYFPDVVYGPVLIKQSSIDALFDSDSDDSSQSPEAISDGTLTVEAPQSPVDETKGSDNAQTQPQRLGTEDQRKGGRVSKYHRGVQEFVDRLSDELGPSLTLGQLESWLTKNAKKEEGYDPDPTIPDFDDVEYYDKTLWWKDIQGQLNSFKKQTLERYIARAKSRDRSSLS